MISLACAVCQRSFQVQLYRQNTAKFCSRSCASTRSHVGTHKVELRCTICQTTYYKFPFVAKGSKYCSRSCQNIGHRAACGPSSSLFSRVQDKCHACGRPTVKIASVKYRTNYCSKLCYESARGTTTIQCLTCLQAVSKQKCDSDRKYCSRKCMGRAKRRAHLGSGNPNWQKGRDKEAQKFYSSKQWRTLRLEVLARDGHKCTNCGVAGGRLEVNHIQPRSVHPELKLDISNLETLCHQCHTAKTLQMWPEFGYIGKTRLAHRSA